MLFLLLSPFVACSNDTVSEDVIRLSWNDGQVFHIASSRRMIANMTEESSVSLDPSTTDDTFNGWAVPMETVIVMKMKSHHTR